MNEQELQDELKRIGKGCERRRFIDPYSPRLTTERRISLESKEKPDGGASGDYQPQHKEFDVGKHTINIAVKFDRHGPNAQLYRDKVRQRIREIREDRTKWEAEEDKR